MPALRVVRVDDLATGGATYRLYFEERGHPPITATLFARFENGAGLFMNDDAYRPLNPSRKSARWFLVEPDGRVVQQGSKTTFTLNPKKDRSHEQISEAQA